jgi:hypothetical protein
MIEVDWWAVTTTDGPVMAGPTEGSAYRGLVPAGAHMHVVAEDFEETPGGGKWWLHAEGIPTADGRIKGWIRGAGTRPELAAVNPDTDLVTPGELAAAMRTLIEYVDQVRAGQQE